MIAHLADDHLGFVLCGLTLLAHLARGAVPAEPLDQVALQLRLYALAVPVALARLALQSIVVLSHCSDALVAILASVGVIVDNLARWLLGRRGLFRARER